jgi:hypothetical protein
MGYDGDATSHVGTAGVGVFAHVGPAWLPGGETSWTATAGIAVRLPSTFGVWIGIPGC